VVQPGLYNHNFLSRRCLFSYPDYWASRFHTSILFYETKQCHITEERKSAGLPKSFTFLWKCSSLEGHFFKNCVQIYLVDVLIVLCRSLQLSLSNFSAIEKTFVLLRKFKFHSWHPVLLHSYRFMAVLIYIWFPDFPLITTVWNSRNTRYYITPYTGFMLFLTTVTVLFPAEHKSWDGPSDLC
jgi:hypothetical protein